MPTHGRLAGSNRPPAINNNQSSHPMPITADASSWYGIDGTTPSLVSTMRVLLDVDNVNGNSGNQDVDHLLVELPAVAFERDDVVVAGVEDRFERFFWQCSASAVMIAPVADRPSMSSRTATASLVWPL